MLQIQTYFEKLPKEYHEAFEERLDEKMLILDKFLKRRNEIFDIKINAEKIRESEFKVEFRLFYPKKTFSLEKYGKDPVQTLEIAFTAFKENITQQLEAIHDHKRGNNRSVSEDY